MRAQRDRKYKLDAYAYIKAGDLLDAVDRWAGIEYWLMRESVATVDGRIDGILIPRAFTASIARSRRGGWTQKMGLIGIEAKASRADFLRGLREGQFARYRNGELAGVFVVTQPDVKTSEVPDGVGHLVVREKPNMFLKQGLTAVCKRNPAWTEFSMSQDTMWRLVFYAVQQAKDERQQLREKHQKTMDKVGERVARAIAAATSEREEF